MGKVRYNSLQKIFTALIAVLSVISFCADKAFASELKNAAANDALIQGFEAYRNGDWNSAAIFLRKAVTVPENSTPEAWYMLVMSQIYSENYSAAVNDCDTFLDRFDESILIPGVEYQKGRALHFLGQNDSAVLVLSDFCHQNPDNNMYPSALYWLAECFFEDFNFDTARSLYERIITDFPDSEKKDEAQFKLDLITQREREQKLLYLLKMTGEEYLSSRENYEKQLREYQTQDLVTMRRELNAAKQRIKDLEAESARDKAQAQELQAAAQAAQESRSSKVVSDEEMASLKAKAALLQSIMDSSSEGK